MNTKGRALEDLVCYVYSLVPGVSVSHRNQMDAFRSEEIDVALWNTCTADGFHFLPNIILLECKNCATRVGSQEVSWFVDKLRNRGMEFGILVTTSGITGDASELNAAHNRIATALTEGRRVVVIRTSELAELEDTAELVELVQKKLCELVVRRAVG